MGIKFLCGMLIVLFLLGTLPAIAGEEQPSSARKTSKAAANKCWERTWKTSEALVGRSTMPVCLAFEKVLNATCESPAELSCNWSLPPGESKFKKLNWQSLDWRAHWDLIGDINKAGVREDLRESMWKREEAEKRALFEKGRRSIAVTHVDIDQDGNDEMVVRNDLIPCKEKPGSMFAVIKPEDERVDWRYDNLFIGINANAGAEIFIYDGKAYMFKWNRTWEILFVYKGFSMKDLSSYGYVNICQFRYLKRER